MSDLGSRFLQTFLSASLVCGLLAGTPALADLTEVNPKSFYPEGPIWQNGKLFYVEYARNRVMVWDGKTNQQFWEQDHCGANAVIPFGKDHLLVACYDANALVELDGAGKALRTFTKDAAGKPFTGPNDFAADPRGGVFFSASGVYDVKAPITGAVLHLSEDGSTIKRLADTIDYSNGLTVSRDGKMLLVAEMLAGRILAFSIADDGTLGPRTVWARLQDIAPPTPHEDAYNGPDGLKLGPDDNYYIAQNGSGRVLVADAHAKLVRIIKVATPFVTNMAFGPDGADTVFVTGAFDQWKEPYPGVVYRWTK